MDDAIRINKGYVMTDMYSSISGSTHNVVVVGYTLSGNGSSYTGNLIYWDPETGDYMKLLPCTFNIITIMLLLG